VNRIQAASAADLTVTIKDVRNVSGNVLVVVYNESKSLRKGASSSWKTPSYRASISPRF
jgi:uncharacterized protein (DUF2141 family)